MALPVLDGNQTATTLSSVVTGGEHIVAHSVVSLGANAIANITSAVSGSVVSISNFPATQPISGSISISGTPSVTFSAVSISNFPSTQTIAGTVTANLAIDTGPITIYNTLPITGQVTLAYGENFIGEVAVSSLPAISGTVTVGAMPNGALTTRFGSVTTANLATLTSAVTNTSRKYLLLQNIATSTVTIGIGFAPTTTQGIQLPAGGGLTFDAFCPTGGVWWLSGVTSSNFCVIEG